MCFMKTGERQPFGPEEWLKNDKSHLRIRTLAIASIDQKETSSKDVKEALKISLQMVPHLNNLEHMFVNKSVNERFDFLWKRPCHTLNYYIENTNILKWHLENNDRLKSIKTCILYYGKVRDLISLCAEKRLTWEMRFGLTPNTLECVKTWQGDAQWDEIYPTVTNKNIYVEYAQPEDGTAFYEDDHTRKEFLWSSENESSLTITWK
uniref:FTH domain-containing protein n=1 Tax=Steinernema glaseri TaxID=37863 RepID=A0A1I7Y774_9BILA